MMLLLSTQPTFAQGQVPIDLDLDSPELCFWVNDAAYEHSLRDGLSDADQTALTNTFETATYECLGLHMMICEDRDDSVECLSSLSSWVRAERAEIIARLPAEIEYDNAFTARRYTRTVERAGAPADEADCDHMSEAERERYCEIVAEGRALEDAYDAWRMARREGAVELVGHDPVELELIR